MSEQISSYRLEEEIARGGMGIVYRSVHTVFDEVVAIKAIFPELTLDPVLRERFLNEAKIQRRLQHPNIVQIREFLTDQGKFYIVMEFVDGETLAHRLLELGRPMEASQAIEIFHQALEGLGFAHSQGVIHRDIKPSNIMLTRDGVVKLTDFGIARALGAAKLTTTGTSLGTPAYMSPEQIQGKKIDRRSDVYSMGVTLHEMLTGRVPFQAAKGSENAFSVLAAHISQTPAPPSDWVPGIPLALEAAILKALEKRRENRFSSCQEFQAALAPFVLAPTRKVSVTPEAELGKACGPAQVPRLSAPRPELRPQPRPVPSPMPRIILGPPPKQKRSQDDIAMLVLGVMILIVAALAWAYLPRHKPDTAQLSAPQEETIEPAQPETAVPAPNVSIAPTNVAIPPPDIISAPAQVASPQPHPAQILVVTSPTAQVYLDDALKGQANQQGRLRIESVEPGDHRVRVSLAGRKDYEEGATIATGQVTEIIAMLANVEQPSPPARVEIRRPSVYTPVPRPADVGMGSQPMEARRHASRAAMLLSSRQYAEAASEYRAAIQLDPQNANLHSGLATALGLEEDWDGQIAEDREALRLDPNSDRAHTGLGMALARKMDREGAMAEFRAAIRLNSNNEAAHLSLGGQLSRMGDWDGAIAEYNEVVRLHPNDYPVHYSLGIAYERKGDRQAALQEYRTAYELNPNIPSYKLAYDRLILQANR